MAATATQTSPSMHSSILRRIASSILPQHAASIHIPSFKPTVLFSDSLPHHRQFMSSSSRRRITQTAASPFDTTLESNNDIDDENYIIPPPPSPPRNNTTQHRDQRRPTGAFQRLPMVAPSRELIESALRRAERVGSNKKLKNEAARAKNRAARQLDTLMKELTGPLGTYERGFPPIKTLHPFEQALLDLTLSPGSYERSLARVTALRKASVEVAKGYAARASKAANKKDAVELQAEGFAKVEAVYQKGAGAVDELKEVAKSLRILPVVDPGLPTVALVGAPNVGKSSLVQLLSSGVPEVQNYPFTTRSIKMGHFYVDSRRYQVTDTPGLLPRPDIDRNAMERLTLASLEHLPTAVLFVVDLTGECGTSVQDQWKIRNDLKRKFPEKPWLDVFSKSDLLEEELDEAKDAVMALTTTTTTDTTTTTTDTTTTTTSTASTSSSVDEKSTEIHHIESAVDFAMNLPMALPVSSKTGDGIDELKSAMLDMLQEYDLQHKGGIEAWPSEVEDMEGES